ncbi:uncharacterized protein [Clytia hemisphaerica]|uniref:Cnidarian restricted protein n=1 Tax=Clytia hemisphaerica TaxID=252671 RepID=A0A7M5WS50_9CNID|eukprot:TCONS_00061692-protein
MKFSFVSWFLLLVIVVVESSYGKSLNSQLDDLVANETSTFERSSLKNTTTPPSGKQRNDSNAEENESNHMNNTVHRECTQSHPLATTTTPETTTVEDTTTALDTSTWPETTYETSTVPETSTLPETTTEFIESTTTTPKTTTTSTTTTTPTTTTTTTTTPTPTTTTTTTTTTTPATTTTTTPTTTTTITTTPTTSTTTTEDPRTVVIDCDFSSVCKNPNDEHVVFRKKDYKSNGWLLHNPYTARAYIYVRFYPNHIDNSAQCELRQKTRMTVSFIYRPGVARQSASFNRLYLYVYSYKLERVGWRYKYIKIDSYHTLPFGPQTNAIAHSWNRFSVDFNIKCGRYMFVYISTASYQNYPIELDNLKILM